MNFPSKILIVDDEPHVRAFVTKLAEANLGAPTLFEAPDAETALATFSREQPDLVLLDTHLIGTSGLDLLEQLRALNEDVVIIMLSTVSAMSAIQEAVERGANGYVLKHVGSDKVAKSLVEAVTDSFGGENPA